MHIVSLSEISALFLIFHLKAVKISGRADSETNVGTAFATDGIDFNLEGEHEVIFQEGETTVEITIPINNDRLIELNEEFYVEITEADSEINNARKIAKVVILNDDGK